MPIGDYCEKPAATVSGAETVRAVAQRMKHEGLGSLAVVVDGRPVGIVTDRDLVLETLGNRISVDQNAPVREAVRMIRRHAIRRLPVVDEEGDLVGIVAADDLLALAAAELGGLAVAVRAQFPGNDPGRR
jgi:CBS domain-containing protein